ncbi:helix-turn-helix domain-containing protein [Kribbella sp. CA-293567]|uniref:helix-turn-helix domain-containing protein n=1 Tax=Kribbella sp. CA-293567 TaxID=3002436 RepID=UPI0022DE0003|nr:helix-turn-helix domain-containing protein [Kribbella sp. CA-293567]WBQ04716.1 helix-turn-helix domain-containing protein [Kribbella sp. CA-293567]
MEKAVDNRLAELERRIAALESAALSTGTDAVGKLPEGDGWAALAGPLAALGNPVRLTLLQEISRGRATVTALSEVEGLGTSGQIYHHLRQLTAEGWLHTPTRGTFAVPPPRLVALLAILEALQR